MDSRFSPAASCSRSTRFFNASFTSVILSRHSQKSHQPPEAPPPPLLPPPNPPNPPPPEYPPEPPPKPPPRQPPLIPPSMEAIHHPLPRPPPRPDLANRKKIKIIPSQSKGPSGVEMSWSRRRRGRLGGWPDSVTPRSSAMYFASVHAAVS